MTSPGPRTAPPPPARPHPRGLGLARTCATAAAIIWTAGCRGARFQSALEPAGPGAQIIANLWWLLFWVCAAVFAAVLLLAAAALLWRRDGRPPVGDRFIVASGIVLPAVILIGLTLATLRSTLALGRAGDDPAYTVRVLGYQWWWEVRYPELGIIDANEIHVPVGRTVALDLESADVIHSFWVPNLHGKMDMIPGHRTRFWIRADRPGVYRGQCAEYCGTQHALMAFAVVAHEPEEFERWLAARRSPTPAPATADQRRGYEVFFEAACNNCHAIAGTPADGRIGPDLTHIGSRRTLGAGTIPNNPGNLAGWIANPQPIKPGNKMPPSHLASQDLLALVQYLETLK